MRIAIFPGSFAPFHKGHLDIINQIIYFFDKIYIVHMVNPEKKVIADFSFLDNKFIEGWIVGRDSYDGLLVDYVSKLKTNSNDICIIRGLRTSLDFEYEKAMQYYNEDLGLDVPTMYLIANRDLVHISSSAERMLKNFKK